MRVQPHDVECEPRPHEIALQLMQSLHHAVIDELRAFEIDDDAVLLIESELAELPSKGNPVRKHGRTQGVDLHRAFIKHGHLEKRLEHRLDRQPIQQVNEELDDDADQHTDQQVGCQHAHERGRKDDQLLAADLVDTDEFARRRESTARIDEHRCQRCQRDRANQSWREGDEGEQQQSVPEISESRAGTIVDVGLAPHDLRDHRQASNRRRCHVGDTHGDQILVELCLSSPGIDHVNRLGAEQRLEAPDQRKHHYPQHAGAAGR